MRHRNDRHVDSRERSDLAGVHTAGVDDDLGLDLAPIGLDRFDATSSRANAEDARSLLDLGPAAARSFGERERELAGVDVAVRGKVRSSQDAIGRDGREEPLRFLGRDELEREAEGLRPARLPRDLVQPLGRRGKPERAHLVPAGLELHLVLEPAIELDTLHHHLRQRERAAELADETRGVEGRAARQLGTLDEDDVVPAEPREPVCDCATADAASDDDRPSATSHARTLRPRARRPLAERPFANCDRFVRTRP